MNVLHSDNKQIYEIQLLKLIQRAKGNSNILAVMIYGSYLKNQSFRDIDICIFIYPNIIYKLDKLEFLMDFSGNVPDIFDIHIFQDLPLYIQERVLNQGKILFNRDFNTLFNIFQETHKDYNLFLPHYRHYLGEN